MKRGSVATVVNFSGVGLHSGKKINIRLVPAKSGDGIFFKRVDITDRDNIVRVDFKNVSETMFSTLMSNPAGVKVCTTEHLLAALWCEGITDLEIQINGEEVPTMDGASQFFVLGLKSTPKITFSQDLPLLTVEKTITVGDEKAYITASPSDEFIIEASINFACKEVGQQTLTFNATNRESFISQISHAKTFALKKDYDHLKSIGYAQGGDVINGLLLEEDKIFNKQSLTLPDDFVRHKILDFIGDLYTSLRNPKGHFKLYRSGHKLNNLLLQSLIG
jgi:UDP-3-O-[3-hydroxymyristoyl] N-acetylglucosamine deacetylase